MNAASGLLNGKETAQEYVLTGVGLMAGSSILLLTLLWGTCNVLGRRDFAVGMESGPSASSQASNSLKQWAQKLLESLAGECNNEPKSGFRLFGRQLFRFIIAEKLLLLIGSGVITDLETSYTARIMTFSVIPFAIIQLEKLFPLPSEQRAVLLSTLIVSAILLLLYFIYQVSWLKFWETMMRCRLQMWSDFRASLLCLEVFIQTNWYSS